MALSCLPPRCVQALEKEFAKQAEANNLVGLAGHRSVGGLRASLYNAVGMDSVQTLIEFMGEFQNRQSS